MAELADAADSKSSLTHSIIQITGTISEVSLSMSLQPSSSLANQVSGTVLAVSLKQRPDDEFDIDLAMAKKSGLIPQAGSIDTNSLSGRNIEITFNPAPATHATFAPPTGPEKTIAIYTINSLRVISGSGK